MIRCIRMIVIVLVLSSMTLASCSNLFPKKIDNYTSNLIEIYNLQKSYHRVNGVYAASLDDIYFMKETYTLENDLYKFEVSYADSTSFIVKAICIKDANNDGVCDQWQITDKKSIEKVVGE